MKEKIEICVVIILYNSGNSLPTFIECLINQTYKNWKLVVVDNASSDGPRGMFSAINKSNIEYLYNNKNKGFAKAANQGIRRGLDLGYQRFLLLNTDVYFQNDFMLNFIEKWNMIGGHVVSPRIMYMNDHKNSWYAGGHFENDWIFQVIHEKYDDNERASFRDVGFVSGCCLGIEIYAIEKIGLFDETFFVYWEDSDFCMRLSKNDIKMYYIEDSVIFHYGGLSSGGEFTISYINLYYESYAKFLRKHFGVWLSIQTLLRITLRELQRSRPRYKQIAATAAAMTRGMIMPLRQEPRI